MVAPDVIFTSRAGARVEDLRTAPGNPYRMNGRTSVLGHLISEQSTNRPVVDTQPAGEPTPTIT